MKRCLVTGASGFVGNNLARRLLRDGHEVHVLLRQGHATWRLQDIYPDLHVHIVDLCDAGQVERAVQTIRPEWIFHLAAYGAYSHQTDIQRIMQTNILGTVNLVQACLETGFEAFVNTGSSSEYGFQDHAPAETEPLEPNSHYAVAKASATMFCRYTAQSRDVHLTTLRLYSVYGPYEEPTRLLPTLIVYGLRNQLPPLVNPDVARDYVYIDDALEAYLLAAARPTQERGAVYNVGTGIQTTLRQVVSVAKQILGIEAEPVWSSMPNRRWDTTVWVADNRKIQRELGWEPCYTFEQGFCKMVDWLRHNLLMLKFYECQLKTE